MLEALAMAKAASSTDDVPVGAVAVHKGTIVAKAHNLRESTGDPTAHAEILVLRACAEKFQTWRLSDLHVYVTLEPCPMCAGALVAARVARVVFGAFDEKAGAALSLYNIVQDPRLNHQCELVPGLLAEESASLLNEFFLKKRGKPPPYN